MGPGVCQRCKVKGLDCVPVGPRRRATTNGVSPPDSGVTHAKRAQTKQDIWSTEAVNARVPSIVGSGKPTVTVPLPNPPIVVPQQQVPRDTAPAVQAYLTQSAHQSFNHPINGQANAPCGHVPMFATDICESPRDDEARPYFPAYVIPGVEGECCASLLSTGSWR
jgi:hypothetical protein